MSLSDAIKDELNSGKLPDLRGRVVIRDVIDLLYVDKTLRDLVNGKLEVKRERN